MRTLLFILCLATFGYRVEAQVQSLPTDSDTARLVSMSNLKRGSKTMIALTFGQSNADNYGKTPYTPHNTNVFNYYAGKLYVSKDPLLGTTGLGGSVWARLGDNKGVMVGPDTDTLIHAIHRYDGVHFSDFGMAAYAQLWFRAILNNKEKCL